ncbi:MAG: aspartate--tRNA ligase [Acidobacteria bacterium RIFCSPLOWO2_02_FULL_64_15]|nr:MAG: aspartate--tRNA ligase [Acidobacteria bacterium RIFCSPLOWO2_02_FULL_64_15]
MAEALGNLARTHTCGALRTDDVGASAMLLGWVHRVRDLGGVTFIDVRDRAGVSQVVVRENDTLMPIAKRLRSEYVVAVSGVVQRRSEETVNPKIATGDVEVLARDIRILNEAKTPPFQIADDAPVSEDVRLRYRYLDLRRPRLQENIGLRHRVALAVRKYFDANGFWEIETPILTKSTPEGARDYLVPSRVHQGEFYALPQSPQIFKQILMIGGADRYFQIVRCFRDEDLRADRQPEFTQIDVEVSFAHPDVIYDLIEPAMRMVFLQIKRDIAIPFRRMPYAEAIATYGSDKPDLRFGMEIRDLSDAFRESEFRVFRQIVAEGGVVRGFAVPGGNRYSRSQLDALVDQAKQMGFAGLIWVRPGEPPLCSVKALGEAALRPALDRVRASSDDLLLMAAGPPDATSRLLGQLRLAIGKKENLLDPNQFAFTWVTDFPLLEYHQDDGRWYSMHHPFTSPFDEDLDKLESDPGAVRAKAYDLVLNGSEIGGGSIRIHDAALQSRVFRRLGISGEEAKARFGFFLEALEYGTPPHGGIALGLDRIIAILAGESSIREVIAFPKTANAVDLMAGAPSPVDAKQLRELHLRVGQ